MLKANIKSRRLGYLKLLGIYMLTNRDFIIREFNQRFEIFAASFDKQFSSSIQDSGRIHLANGKSSRSYVELAESLKLISREGKRYGMSLAFDQYVTKAQIADDFQLVPLNKHDISFFIELLFKMDRDTSFLLLSFVFRRSGQHNIHTLRNEFLTHLLQTAKGQSSLGNFNQIIKIEKAPLYGDEIFYPRLHWLFDLGLIEIDSNKQVKITLLGLDVLHANSKQC